MNYFKSEVERLTEQRDKAIKLAEEAKDLVKYQMKEMTNERAYFIITVVFLIVMYLSK